MDEFGIVTFREGDRVFIGRVGPVFIRDGIAFSANKLLNKQYEIRYEIQTKRDCAYCGVNPEEFGITRD